MERSFAREIESLKIGDGEVFHGQGIPAVTDASGGAPVVFTPLRREPANVH